MFPHKICLPSDYIHRSHPFTIHLVRFYDIFNIESTLTRRIIRSEAVSAYLEESTNFLKEFRGFLLLLPRKISTAEIYRYYQVKKYLGDDGRGAGRVTMEG